MDKVAKEIIHSEFEKIKNKIAREGFISQLYGIPVDVNDFEMMVVSAYYMACQEKQKEINNTNDTWAKIAGVGR